jgi:hypothetical protein
MNLSVPHLSASHDHGADLGFCNQLSVDHRARLISADAAPPMNLLDVVFEPVPRVGRLPELRFVDLPSMIRTPGNTGLPGK